MSTGEGLIITVGARKIDWSGPKEWEAAADRIVTIWRAVEDGNNEPLLKRYIVQLADAVYAAGEENSRIQRLQAQLNGVMNCLGPPEALQRVCGSSLSKAASRASCNALAHGWKGTSSILMLFGM